MSNQIDTILNSVFSLLLNKETVPENFHDQVKAVRKMMKNDITGLVDSLTDFAVDSASVDINITTKNKNFDEILNKWLKNINKEYKGQIPTGVGPLSREYYKERWKYSSFPVLKIAGWEKYGNLFLPSKMFFIDGGSIQSKERPDSEEIQLINYDYYLGNVEEKKNKLDKGVIFGKECFGRWFDEYPTPFLIKRGIYRNWLLINALKNHETKVLDMIVPYLLQITKGGHFGNNTIKTYSNDELAKVADDFKQLIREIKDPDNTFNKIGIRASNFDEEIKQLIPDLKSIFEPQLFAMAERNILSGMGFIDVAEASTVSRRASILNPKGFVEQVKTGVNGFKQMMKDLFTLIEEKNKKNTKYMNLDVKIVSSPVRGFISDDFKQQIRQLYDRGRISSQTAVELIGEIDFETEVYRRQRETEEGIEQTMYPVVTRNQEDKSYQPDYPNSDKEEDTLNREIPDDKRDEQEKKEYDIGKVVLKGAPYDTISELPENVKDNMSEALQKIFVEVFNETYKETKDEEKARKAAWAAIKNAGRKSKTDNDKWVKK